MNVGRPPNKKEDVWGLVQVGPSGQCWPFSGYVPRPTQVCACGHGLNSHAIDGSKACYARTGRSGSLCGCESYNPCRPPVALWPSLSMLVPDAVNGIDLCGEFQWPIDAVAIKKAGFEFAYIQSSRYSSQRAGNFDKLVGSLRDAGLSVGAYHFCSHDSDPIQQARFFYAASHGLGTNPGELPPMADWEHCTPSHYPDHPQHCVSWIAAFLREAKGLWYGHGSRSPVIYSYPNYCGLHQPALARELELGAYPLCYASYRQDGGIPLTVGQAVVHPIPRPWTKWALCQYSGNVGVRVPGVPGPCDRQVFNGASGDFAMFLGIPRPVSSGTFDVKEDYATRV